jgi:hypothetical protein
MSMKSLRGNGEVDNIFFEKVKSTCPSYSRKIQWKRKYFWYSKLLPLTATIYVLYGQNKILIYSIRTSIVRLCYYLLGLKVVLFLTSNNCKLKSSHFYSEWHTIFSPTKQRTHIMKTTKVIGTFKILKGTFYWNIRVTKEIVLAFVLFESTQSVASKHF